MDRLEFFIKQTERRFDKVDLKLEEIAEFKVRTIATARTVSFIVSAICGFLTLLATVALAWPRK